MKKGALAAPRYPLAASATLGEICLAVYSSCMCIPPSLR